MPPSDDEKAPRAQLDETRRTAQEADEVEVLYEYHRAKRRDWEREQRAKVAEVLANIQGLTDPR